MDVATWGIDCQQSEYLKLKTWFLKNNQLDPLPLGLNPAPWLH